MLNNNKTNIKKKKKNNKKKNTAITNVKTQLHTYLHIDTQKKKKRNVQQQLVFYISVTEISEKVMSTLRYGKSAIWNKIL